jgi:hypothetical protein
MKRLRRLAADGRQKRLGRRKVMTMSRFVLGCAAGAISFGVIVADTEPSRANTVTACSVNQFCYCIHSDFKQAIDDEVATIRKMIRDQRQFGKAIGYMSISLSGSGGGYFPLNVKIANEMKERVEERFGVASVWVLNPIASNIGLPPNASQGDYMFMWTQVLEGQNGLGDDFDFVYFVGPSDIGKHFGLNGSADMQKLEAYYDGLAKTDPRLSKKVDKKDFRNYYALRASVAFSVGAHDEWNIVRAINEARRTKNGIVGQLGVLFDGLGIAPGLYETPVAAGNASAKPCPP